MLKREVIPFTNDEKQVINPGDAVVAVTVSTGCVSTYLGTYLGQVNGKCQVEVEYDGWDWVDKDTGLRGKWGDPNITYREVRIKRITTLQLNRIYKTA